MVVSSALTPFPADDGKVGIGTTVQVAFKNIGDTVALNVGYDVWMLAAPLGWPKGGDLASLHAAKCEEFGHILGRRALFPDESFCEFDGKLVSVDGEAVRRATMPMPDRSEVALIIGGIVTYNIAADDAVHRTSFHYVLGYRDEYTAIPISPAPIPAENIRVFQGHSHHGTEPARYVD